MTDPSTAMAGTTTAEGTDYVTAAGHQETGPGGKPRSLWSDRKSVV